MNVKFENSPMDSLSPEGPYARTIDDLFWLTFWIAVVIFIIVQGALINNSIKKRGTCLLFLGGLIIGSFLYRSLTGSETSITLEAPMIVLVIGGILTGFGTSLGSGCTSGHGICGIARKSMRSLVATLTFMAAGVATVYAMRHLLGV